MKKVTSSASVITLLITCISILTASSAKASVECPGQQGNLGCIASFNPWPPSHGGGPVMRIQAVTLTGNISK